MRGDLVRSALPSVVIAIELFSELYIRFMTLFKAHESAGSWAHETNDDDDDDGTLYPSQHDDMYTHRAEYTGY